MKCRIRWENKNFDDMGTLTTFTMKANNHISEIPTWIILYNLPSLYKLIKPPVMFIIPVLSLYVLMHSCLQVQIIVIYLLRLHSILTSHEISPIPLLPFLLSPICSCFLLSPHFPHALLGPIFFVRLVRECFLCRQTQPHQVQLTL